MIDFNVYFNNLFSKRFSGIHEKILIKTPIKLPTKMFDDKMILRIAKHYQNGSFCYKYKTTFFLEKEQLRNIGLLLLYQVFSNVERIVEINVLNSSSEIKKIVIYSPYIKNIFFKEMNSRFMKQATYYKFKKNIEESEKRWFENSTVHCNLPDFAISNKEEWESIPDRDILKIGGSANGLVILADLLLNMSLDENNVNEIELDECCTSKGSDFVRFVIPSVPN